MRLAYEQGLLKGDLHYVGTMALTLALVMQDSVVARREDLQLRAVLGIPLVDEKQDVEEDDSVRYSADEFRRRMAELSAKATEDNDWE